jgi:cytochrome c553
MLRFTCRLTLFSSLVACGFASGQEPPDEAVAFFEKKIRPVLVAECYGCHSVESGKKVRGGLALDSREGARKGGDTGPVIVPGNPSGSLLIKALGHGDPKLSMPPKKKLDATVVRDFEEWIRMGAPDPRNGVKVARKEIDIEQGRNHWAYQPPKKGVDPKVKKTAWPRTDVDRFILAALETKGLTPAEDADRRTLLRRVSFDLIGLPPTPAEVEAFVADTTPDAFEKVVDRLLASPRFGEKWARHWLDLARYAESTGKTVNFSYPHAWRYRDYVIAAFNADKPYDQFIKEQLAGDLMKSEDPKVQAERLIATGFLALGPKTLNERNGLKFELDVVDEQIDVTTQAFLGITAACARCHDHKFDPIPQKDYYALAGIFRSTETCYGTVRYINAQRVGPLLSLPNEANPASAASKLTDAQRKRIEDQIKAGRDSMKTMRDPTQQFFASGRLSLLQAGLDAYDADGNPKLLAMGVRDKPARADSSPPRGGFAGFTYNGTRAIADSPVYQRGEPDQPTDARVPRGALQVMTKTPLKVPSTGSGRLELAEWIASKENPLTARVMVNRVWLHVFGRGLVPTADDFGLAGRPPTHPELLDHLAHSFMDNGWSVKKLVKHLMMSHVYQLGSMAKPGAMELDPDNTLLWRISPRRLDAESLRDAMLAVSEQLNTTAPVGSVVARAGEGPVAQPRMGGDPIAAAINDPRNTHRSIYLPLVRDNLPEALSLFDAADPALIITDRPKTTVPSQGLFLLNNAFVMRASDAAADRLLKSGETERERLRGAFVQFYSRPPTTREKTAAEAFLKAYREQMTKDGVAAAQQDRELWSAFCQALFASAEFQYRK